MAIRLTKGQAAFFRAVDAGELTMFHRSVIEPVEKLGLVWFTGGFRLVGCNSFSSGRFILTDEGHEYAAMQEAA